MFSNTLSFLSSHNVSDQASHPYKTTGKNIVTIGLKKVKPYQKRQDYFTISYKNQ